MIIYFNGNLELKTCTVLFTIIIITRDLGSCALVHLSPTSNSNTKNVEIPVHLKYSRVDAAVVPPAARVRITQVYENKEEGPVEVFYYFLVDPNGAVTLFVAELDGKKIKAVVTSHAEAKEQYSKAVEDERTALLGAESKVDVFKASIGNLKPGSEVKIILEYVTELKNEEDAIRFYIPTTVAPRYISSKCESKMCRELLSAAANATLDLRVIVSVQGGVKSIVSPSHKVIVKKDESLPVDETLESKATVEFHGNINEMNRDFVLLITPAVAHKPLMYAEKVKNSSVVMVHWIPNFKVKELRKVELILAIDRSRTMGQHMELAKKAMILFMHSLPTDCYFNLIEFGSSWHLLFPKSTKYDHDTLKTALERVQNMRSDDSDGADMISPLKQILAMEPIPEYHRQIFIIIGTGQVENTDEVINLVKWNAHQSRIFALGIGTAVSHNLVEGIARAGRGTSAFVRDKSESIGRKVLEQLKNSFHPALENVRLSWHGVKFSPRESSQDPRGKSKNVSPGNEKLLGITGSKSDSTDYDRFVYQIPKELPPIFNGSHMLIFSVFRGAEVTPPDRCLITADSPDGLLAFRMELSAENRLGSRSGMLFKLAAIKAVRELETQLLTTEFDSSFNKTWRKKLKKRITEVAIHAGIASKYTSFVAVVNGKNKSSHSAGNWVVQTKTRRAPLQYTPTTHNHGSEHGIVKRDMTSWNDQSVTPLPPMSESELPEPEEKIFRSDHDHESFRHLVLSGGGTSKPKSFADLEPMLKFLYFNGLFDWDRGLIHEIGVDLVDAKEEAYMNRWDLNAWATTLALVHFSEALMEHKESWELIAEKGRQWLLKYHGCDVPAMTAAAKEIYDFYKHGN